MKNLLTAAAIIFGLLTGTAAHAAPTCHQRVTVAFLEYLKDTVPVSTKVSKMIREQELDVISSSADDYHAKAIAYVTAVATATADVMKAAVTDEIKDLAVQTADSVVTSFGQTDKYQKDPHVADGLKNGVISDARIKIITAFFACKPTPPLPDSVMAAESAEDTAKAEQPESKAPPLPDSAMAGESGKDTAKNNSLSDRSKVITDGNSVTSEPVGDAAPDAKAIEDERFRVQEEKKFEAEKAKEEALTARYEKMKEVRIAFVTDETTAALEKALKFFATKNGKEVPGRECEPDVSDGLLSCDMEDGVQITAEAVPLKTTQAEANALCSDESNSRYKTEFKKGGKTFKVLYCLHPSTEESRKEAKVRIHGDPDAVTTSEGLPNYANKTLYECDKHTITEKMTSLIANSPAGNHGISLLYVKDNPIEVGRSKNSLKCRITIALNNAKKVTGIFSWTNEDGNALVGFKPK